MAIVPAGEEAFSDLEEEFFRTGDSFDSLPVVETFADLDTGPPPPTVWQRIFKRNERAATEPPPPPRFARRAPTARPDEDDDWDWEIAIARARHRPATSPG